VWHASIALQARGNVIWPTLIPFARWRLQERACIRDVVIGLISGVGHGDTRRDRSEHVLHARRKLSPAEIAMLDPAWCELPAIDIAGGETPW
jgi:hypothetical protein